MPVVKLNARNITTLQAVGGVRTDYRDELLPGFFLRVTPQGTRTYGIVYTTRDGRLRRCTLGPVGPLGLSQARAQAKRLRGAVAQGEDPHGDRMTARRQRGTAVTVEDLVEAFLASKNTLAWRPKTRQEFARILRVEVSPGPRAPEARGGEAWRDPRPRRPPLRPGPGHGEPCFRGQPPALNSRVAVAPGSGQLMSLNRATAIT